LESFTEHAVMNTSEPVRTTALNGSLEVYLLGLVDYDAALYLQEQLSRDVAEQVDGRGALLVCEHPPLITIGREGSRSEIHCDADQLAAREIEVRWINRGGRSIIHVPGQLVVYPILPLACRGWGLAAYREKLEEALLDMCRELRVRAWQEKGAAGVFCRGGQLAHVGVAVRSSISAHGLFVNVNPHMDLLRLVRSENWRSTSLTAQRGTALSTSAVRESLVRRLAARLEYDRYHLYTGHPLLRRTKRVVAYA
jgi:lipoyl(octanoyl) transferase